MCYSMFLLAVPAPESQERIYLQGAGSDLQTLPPLLSQVHPLLISAHNSNFLSLSPQPSPGVCFEDTGQLTQEVTDTRHATATTQSPIPDLLRPAFPSVEKGIQQGEGEFGWRLLPLTPHPLTPHPADFASFCLVGWFVLFSLQLWREVRNSLNSTPTLINFYKRGFLG